MNCFVGMCGLTKGNPDIFKIFGNNAEKIYIQIIYDDGTETQANINTRATR